MKLGVETGNEARAVVVPRPLLPALAWLEVFPHEPYNCANTLTWLPEDIGMSKLI